MRWKLLFLKANCNTKIDTEPNCSQPLQTRMAASNKPQMNREIFVETHRLLLGEVLPIDDKSILELDSDQSVHNYLGDPIIQTIEESQEIISNIRQQYKNHGLGRWAVIEKATGQFMGWSGLKLEAKTVNHHSNFYDLGYRLMPRYWGHGFATESAKAALAYGFEKLHIAEVFADADTNNVASKKVLEKVGLRYVETFDDKGYAVEWFTITRQEWNG